LKLIEHHLSGPLVIIKMCGPCRRKKMLSSRGIYMKLIIGQIYAWTKTVHRTISVRALCRIYVHVKTFSPKSKQTIYRHDNNARITIYPVITVTLSSHWRSVTLFIYSWHFDDVTSTITFVCDPSDRRRRFWRIAPNNPQTVRTKKDN